MKRARVWLCALSALVCAGVAWDALAAEGALAVGGASEVCEREATSATVEGTRRFLALAATQGVFYDQSGPSFVMLMKTQAGTDEVEMGAVGIYADEKKRPVFGAVPWRAYDPFLHEPGEKSASVLLRLEISEPQYERVLHILRDWERRARDNELLYPNELHMNNILLVKQATEALNRCKPMLDLYPLDWGPNDDISENNARSQVALLVFEELKRRNTQWHVPDSAMPAGLMQVRGSRPLAAREVVPEKEDIATAPRPAHEHHQHHHMHDAAGRTP